MMYDYFHRTELDEAFYQEHLLPRLPRVMLDAHAHFNLPRARYPHYKGDHRGGLGARMRAVDELRGRLRLLSNAVSGHRGST